MQMGAATGIAELKKPTKKSTSLPLEGNTGFSCMPQSSHKWGDGPNSYPRDQEQTSTLKLIKFRKANWSSPKDELAAQGPTSCYSPLLYSLKKAAMQSKEQHQAHKSAPTSWQMNSPPLHELSPVSKFPPYHILWSPANGSNPQSLAKTVVKHIHTKYLPEDSLLN